MSDLIESWKVSRYVVNVRHDDRGVALDGPYTGEPIEVDPDVYRTMELLLERIEQLEFELQLARNWNTLFPLAEKDDDNT